jgi:large subunit ribosomal protein L4
VLVVLDGAELDAGKSFRNLAGVNVRAWEDCGVADLVGAATLVLSQPALDALTARARKREEATA